VNRFFSVEPKQAYSEPNLKNRTQIKNLFCTPLLASDKFFLLWKSVANFDFNFQRQVLNDRHRKGITPALPPESEREAIRQQYKQNAADKVAS